MREGSVQGLEPTSGVGAKQSSRLVLGDQPRADPSSVASGWEADVIYHATRALEGSDRWRQAAADNEIETPSAPRIFNTALGVDFDPVRMPTLALLLERMLGDLETIHTRAKQGYFVLAPSSPNR